MEEDFLCPKGMQKDHPKCSGVTKIRTNSGPFICLSMWNLLTEGKRLLWLQIGNAYTINRASRCHRTLKGSVLTGMLKRELCNQTMHQAPKGKPNESFLLKVSHRQTQFYTVKHGPANAFPLNGWALYSSSCTARCNKPPILPVEAPWQN